MNKKILFLGGDGFIGSVLTPKLLRKGYHVTVIDLMIFKNHFKTHENLTVIQGDINDIELIDSLMNNNEYEIVINFAVITDDTGDELLESIRHTTNIDACIELAKKAKHFGCKKFIYASSTSVYGNVKTNEPVDEQYKPAPLTDYGHFKYTCEQALIPMTNEQFAVCCVRPSTVFGCSPRARFDLLVNNLTMTACLENKMILSGSDYIRPNIHIEDITDFYIHIIESEHSKIAGQIFNMTDNNIEIKEFAELIKSSQFPEAEIEIVKPNDHRSYNVSSKKAFSLLGFKPSHSIINAVRALTNELEAEIHDSPMENVIYYNKYKPGYSV